MNIFVQLIIARKKKIQIVFERAFSFVKAYKSFYY